MENNSINIFYANEQKPPSWNCINFPPNEKEMFKCGPPGLCFEVIFVIKQLTVKKKNFVKIE